MKNFVKIIALILSLLCIFSLAACTSSGADDESGKKNSVSKSDKDGICNHVYGSWDVVRRADCENDGLKVRECSKCGNTEDELIPVTEHEFSSYTVTKAATCKETGIKTGVCVNCDKEATEVIPKAEHNYGTNGSAKKCSVCGEANYSIGTQGLLFTLQSDDTYKVRVGTAVLATEITIPATYNGKAVTCIEEDGFSALEKLTSINIPASVKEIGDYAFSYCEKLSSVSFQSGSKLETIGAASFRGCEDLTTMTIPANVTRIEKLAFYQCYSLNEIKFENKENWFYSYYGSKTEFDVSDSKENVGYFVNSAEISFVREVIEIEDELETGYATDNPWYGNQTDIWTEAQTDGWGW